MQQDLGVNSKGERVYITAKGNLVVGEGKKKGEAIANIATRVRAIAAQVRQLCRPTLAEEVEREVAQHPDIVASVNTETGEAGRTVVLPRPYWGTNDANVLGPDASVEELQSAIAKLTASLSGMQGAARSKVEHQIRVLELQLTKTRSNAEVVRRNKERDQERLRQRYGSPERDGA